MSLPQTKAGMLVTGASSASQPFSVPDTHLTNGVAVGGRISTKEELTSQVLGVDLKVIRIDLLSNLCQIVVGGDPEWICATDQGPTLGRSKASLGLSHGGPGAGPIWGRSGAGLS